MLLAVSTNIILSDRGTPLLVGTEDSLLAIAGAGYKYADAALNSNLKPNMPLADRDWEKWTHNLKDMADSLGLTFCQSHGYFVNGTINEISGEYEEKIKRSIIASSILDVPWMVLHPITIKTGDAKIIFEINRDFFSKWGEFAANHHVGIALENLSLSVCGKPYTTENSGEIFELIDSINSPSVGLCTDTGHAHLAGFNVPEFIRKAGRRLRATHIQDNHQNMDEHFAPFNGTIPWNEAMAAFREIDYKGAFAFEIQNLTSCYPVEVQKYLVKFSFELGSYLLTL
jgi:sugar phosphate isomerase/epimerase